MPRNWWPRCRRRSSTAAHEPYGARAVIYASLLDVDPGIRRVQLDMLKQLAEPDVYELTLKLIPSVDKLDVRAYLPLVDMTLSSLRALSPSQYQKFTQCFVKLVQADKRLGLFEWTLHQILLRHLRPQFERIKPPPIVYYGLQQLGEPVSVLLSTLARASQCDDQFAFESGARLLPEVPLEFLPLGAVQSHRIAEGAGATDPGGGQAARAVDRRRGGRDLCRQRGARRGSRAAARHLRHARLPDAAAAPRAAGGGDAGCDMTLAGKLANLEKRADLLRRLRAFFYDRGFLEVETPLVADEVIPELHIEPLSLANGQFLQASPELHMKRLLAAGRRRSFK